MTEETRPVYDCDTAPYWCSDEDYNNTTKTFGSFIDEGAAYEITDKNTPRPWLNYLCNDRFGAVTSNTGLGFTWYKTTLLRVTKYEHPIDYLPRDFEDGRQIIITDNQTGDHWDALADAENVNCIHRPGMTTIITNHNGITTHFNLFVPVSDSTECWMIELTSNDGTPRNLSVCCRQIWAFSKFGIHTAEEGIPYLSIPGKDLRITTSTKAIFADTDNPELPIPLAGLFASPQAHKTEVTDDISERKEGRTFTFKKCALHIDVQLNGNTPALIDVLSAADEDAQRCHQLAEKYISHECFETEADAITTYWNDLLQFPSCQLPDPNMQNFMNVWLKNQLFVTFRYVRSGYIGYRDTLQDSWGYTLMDPIMARKQVLRTLAHMLKDGSCPRNYPPYPDQPDLRRFMDSGTWIAMTIVDYIKETDDVAILNETIPYLDDTTEESVAQHIWKAMDLLFKTRGQYGLCETGDGDWNDALEGISKSGDAVSAWLTMALYHAQNLMLNLYIQLGQNQHAATLKERSDILYNALQENAWDGHWFLYGYTGSGHPIGSHKNTEGQIHLNAQTWAIFSGLATPEQTETIRDSIQQHLATDLGSALLAPAYVHEAAEVGRIANLEPGTFENGSIYQHAVTFEIFADLASGHYAKAVDTFIKLLPTNPDNFDARRTSEPYCMGNYYCGPNHPRYGQNFFTWFTGNPAWLLRAGFDEILGVKADHQGLRIHPRVPETWNTYQVTRRFRGTIYTINFKRAATLSDRAIIVDGKTIEGNLIEPAENPHVDVEVIF